MSATFTFAASDEIDARADVLYGIMADYRVGHPAVLPRPPFTGIVVEEGGYGAGTVVRVGGMFLGTERTLRQRVSEPQPGRVLLETDIDTGQTSTFTFEPIADGSRTRVTIASTFPRRAGIGGWVEQVAIPLMLRPVYKKELRQLAAYAQTKYAAAQQDSSAT